MKFFNLTWCILFILFALLQYNDPDPYIWIPLYGYAAVLCWLYYREKFYPKAYLAGTGIYLLYAVYLLLEDNGVLDWLTKHQASNIAASMKAEQPWIENTREFFGLAIMIAVLLADYFSIRRQHRKK